MHRRAPPGHAPRFALEATCAAAGGKLAGCCPVSLIAQLRVYRQEQAWALSLKLVPMNEAS